MHPMIFQVPSAVIVGLDPLSYHVFEAAHRFPAVLALPQAALVPSLRKHTAWLLPDVNVTTVPCVNAPAALSEVGVAAGLATEYDQVPRPVLCAVDQLHAIAFQVPESVMVGVLPG